MAPEWSRLKPLSILFNSGVIQNLSARLVTFEFGFLPCRALLARLCFVVIFFCFFLSACCEAVADPDPKYNLTVTVQGGFDPSLVATGQETSGILAAEATGAPQAADVPGAGYKYSWSIVSQQRRSTLNGAWTSATGASLMAPEGSSEAELSGTFAIPGHYKIEVKAVADWWFGSGEDRGFGESAVFAVYVTVVNINKLQYRIDGQGQFADIAGPIIVAKDQSVELQALPNPIDAGGFPQNKAEWSTPSSGVNGATGAGDFKTVSFTTHGGKTIEVECGNTVSVSITAYTAAISIKRHGSSDSPSGSTTVAAGGLGGAEHTAELFLQTTPAVANVAFSAPVISSDGQNASGTQNADASWGQSATDGAGKLTGTFTSGNRVETTTITQHYGAQSTVSVTAHQVWNELEGDAAAWAGSASYYEIGNPSPVSYTMTFQNGVPITGHNVEFQARSITGWEWNPTKPVDEDGDGVNDYLGGYDEDIIYYSHSPKLQTGGVYAGLVVFAGTGSGTAQNGGKYSANMTVNDYIGPEGYIDFYTDEVEFDVEDSNASDEDAS